MYRVSLFFTSDRNSWSETHVLTQTTIRLDADGTATAMAKARAALLGTNARIIACRIGVVGSPREARLIDLGSPTLEAPAFTNPVEGQTTADSPHVAVVCRTTGTDEDGRLHQGRIFVSGVPDALITVRGSSPQFSPTPQWTTRFNTFKSLLFDKKAGFKITRRSEEKGVAALVVSNTPPGEIGVRIDGLIAGMAVGSYVSLTGFLRKTQFTPPFQGPYQISQIVAPVSPDTLTTVYLRGSGGLDPNSFLALGRIYRKFPDYVAYESVTPAFASHRNRGGSYGLQRGRSRTKKR